MKREIKFKAWHPLIKKFIMPEKVSNRIDINPLHWHNEHKWHLMQYTGLKDKNGNEIYEGDIIHYNNKRIGFVGYGILNDACCSHIGFGIMSINKSFSLHYHFKNPHYFRLMGWDDIEVIGNIYENKDLL